MSGLISVIVATYNRRDRLKACLLSVQQQEYAPYEVIVVDDASQDETGEMMQREFPQIRYLPQQRNQGPAGARNRGIQEARGDIIAFTDDDCVVPSDWLSRLADGFARHPDVAGVGGYQEAPASLSNAVAQAERTMRQKRWGARASSEQRGGYEVPGLGANNVAYRRDVLLGLGCFDETFPVAGGEDADLKFRIAQRGHALLYVPVKVEHHRSYTLREQWRAGVRRGIGAYLFEAKHDRAPGRGRVMLRFGKRTVLLFLDSIRYPPQVAGVLLLTRLADAWGQWIAASGRRADGKRKP